MVTGRRIQAATGGHGVTWNDDRRRRPPCRPPPADRSSRSSPSSTTPGCSAGFFASKTKFSLWDRSWPVATDTADDHRGQPGPGPRLQARPARLHAGPARSCTCPSPTWSGTRQRLHGPAYLRAVRRTDRRVGTVIDVLRTDPALRRPHHGDPHRRPRRSRRQPHRPDQGRDYRVPFVVWGAGVDPGTDLYALNPDYADPGRARATYAGAQPVRNGDVANLALDLLGLPAVPGSEHDVAQDLDVSASAAEPVARRSPFAGQRPRVEAAPVEALGLLHHHRRRAGRDRGSRRGRGRASARSRG